MLKMFRRVMNMAGPWKASIRASFALSLARGVLAAVPVAMVIVLFRALCEARVSGAAYAGPAPATALLVLLLGVAAQTALGHWSLALRLRANYSLFAEVRVRIGRTLSRVPSGWLNARRLGETSAAATTTLSDAETLSLALADRFFGALFQTLAATAVLMAFEPLAGITALMGTGLAMCVHLRLDARCRSLSDRRQGAQSELVARVLDYARGLATVRSFGMGGAASRALAGALGGSRAANVALERSMSLHSALYQAAFRLAAGALAVMAAWRFAGGALDPGDCVTVLAASFMVYAQAEGAGSMAAFMRLADRSLDRVEAVENAPAMPDGELGAGPPPLGASFEGVSFTYPGEPRPALDSVSFEIAPGALTALVGPSGSGKTTAACLLARFHDPDSGSVRLGWRDLRELTLESLMGSLAIVFQNVWLFDGTVFENIAFGRAGASEEDVREAAGKARIDGFIMSLPNGYATRVGECGACLSGGERQRLSIARAILKDAPVVVLDEATSSLDPENARDVQLAMGELTRGKTVLAIAHRLAVARRADSIVVLDRGRVAQAGTHDELAAREGVYRRFVETGRELAGFRLGSGKGG
ncbi:MAG: ABC transporter ATP-binding protein/permease [Deltaproteobacteria bacterium]|jgi:ATP-binding cassette subfamily B protein|nr:ABC transporter ATP-binding protein/permease [Deltaproteobacteria bacterium]